MSESTPPAATDPAPPAAFTAPLIAAAALAALLRAPDAAGHPVVLDVRCPPVTTPRVPGETPGRDEHDAGHIPGAVHLDLDTDLAGPRREGDGRHPLPAPADWQATLRRAGVGAGSSVVVHDHGDGSYAARAWWMVRWAGLPADRVAVLDGGWAAWTAQGLPVSAEPSRPAPGDLEVAPGAMPVLDADGAAGVAGSGGVLMDGRSPARFRGESEPVDPVAGRIPGAVNVPATELVGPGGLWPAPAVLAARLSALGVAPDAALGAYCGSGVTAAAVVLAVEHSGLRPTADPVPLYVGSWSGWTTDPARPVGTGPDRLRSRP